MKLCIGLTITKPDETEQANMIKKLTNHFEVIINTNIEELNIEGAEIIFSMSSSESQRRNEILNKAIYYGYQMLVFWNVRDIIDISNLNTIIEQLKSGFELAITSNAIESEGKNTYSSDLSPININNCYGIIYDLDLIEQNNIFFTDQSNFNSDFNNRYMNAINHFYNFPKLPFYRELKISSTDIPRIKGLSIIAKRQVIKQLQANSALTECDSQYELIEVENFDLLSLNNAIEKAKFNKVMFAQKKFKFKQIELDRLIADVITDESNAVLIPIVRGENSIRDGQYPNLFLKENVVRNNGNVFLMSVFDTNLVSKVRFEAGENKLIISHKFLLNYMMNNQYVAKLIGDYNIISEQSPYNSNLSPSAKEMITQSHLEVSRKIPLINPDGNQLNVKRATQTHKVVCGSSLSATQKYLIDCQLLNISQELIDGAYFINQDNEIAGVIYFRDKKFNTKSFVRIDAQYTNTSDVKLATLIDFDINQSHLNIEGYDLSKDKNYMAFIAGDENIGLGALVAFHSFKKHNSTIDCKLYTYVDRLEQYLIGEFKLLGVELIDVGEFVKQVDTINSQTVTGMTWPPEVFINYLIPTLNTNYDYAIKLDYDVLILGELELNLITPHSEQLLSSINNLYTSYNMNKIKQNQKLYKENYKLDYEHMKKTGINTGFVIFDIKSYISHDIFNQMLKVYQNIYSLNQEAGALIYADQGLLNLTLDILNIKFKIIDTKYNLTTTNCRIFKGNDIVLIHYTGVVKPWNIIELSEEYMEKKGNMNIFMAYYWLQYVNDNIPSLKDKFETNFDQIFMRAALDLYQSKIK